MDNQQDQNNLTNNNPTQPENINPNPQLSINSTPPESINSSPQPLINPTPPAANQPTVYTVSAPDSSMPTNPSVNTSLDSPMNSNKKSMKKQWIITGALFVLLVIFSLGALYKYQQHNIEKKQNSENSALLNKLSKVLNLPTEKPIISTVFSSDDFKNTPSFRGAQKGDKILIYINADQALLYRPSTNTVIQITAAKTEIQTH